MATRIFSSERLAEEGQRFLAGLRQKAGIDAVVGRRTEIPHRGWPGAVPVRPARAEPSRRGPMSIIGTSEVSSLAAVA
jgi:hypothetical protein